MWKQKMGIGVLAMLALMMSSVITGVLLLTRQAVAQRQPATVSLPTEKTVGTIEQVVAFTGSMPTGVTVTQNGRIFVNFPRWGDPVPFTVAEIKDGQPVAYPNAGINQLDTARAAETFVSVQSVVVDPRNRLWILDTGSIKFGPVIPNGPKLVGIELATDLIFKTIHFPSEVVLPTTYLNDMRFDLRKGQGGIAYITDSLGKGPNGILVGRKAANVVQDITAAREHGAHDFRPPGIQG